MQGRVASKSKPRNRRAALLLLMALSGCWGHTALALGAERAVVVKRLAVQPRVTAETAAVIARRETDGRVLSVTPLEGGQRGYRIRLLLDGGRVTTVLVDLQGSISRPR